MTGPSLVSVDQVVQQARTVLSQYPLVIAIGLGIALALLLLGILLRRRFRPGKRFQRLLNRVDSATILMHPNPDPDAMATAMGVSNLADTVGTETTIAYSGQIRHQENRAFRTVLGLDAQCIESAEDIDDESVVLVDHATARGFENCEQLSPRAVVDHHPEDGSGEVFTDIRPEYGACATILTEYYRELGITPVPADEEFEQEGALPSPIATGLLYGILSDTNNFTRGCTEAEFDASAYLYPGIDEDMLDRIANPPIDAEVLDVVARAISEREVRSPYAVSDVGQLSNVDAIPQAADELLGLEGISAVVVFGEKEETIHLSGRSRDDRVHMGEALRSIVDEIPMSEAGGHARMGGGQISLPHMEGLRPDSGIDKTELREELFAAMAGDL